MINSPVELTNELDLIKGDMVKFSMYL